MKTFLSDNSFDTRRFCKYYQANLETAHSFRMLSVRVIGLSMFERGAIGQRDEKCRRFGHISKSSKAGEPASITRDAAF